MNGTNEWIRQDSTDVTVTGAVEEAAASRSARSLIAFRLDLLGAVVEHGLDAKRFGAGIVQRFHHGTDVGGRAAERSAFSAIDVRGTEDGPARVWIVDKTTRSIHGLVGNRIVTVAVTRILSRQFGVGTGTVGHWNKPNSIWSKI